ncbi:MAG: CpaE family protein, partial [Anaerolineales bacterium]
DYITKPFEPAELMLRVAAQLKRAQMLPAEEARPSGRVIALFSLRGGSGCTSLAVNVAIGIGRLWGTPVPLLDLALPVGVCDSMLNQQPKYRLDDLVTRPVEELDGEVIDGFLTSQTTHVRLLGGFDDPVMAEKLTENLTSFIIEHLRQRYAHLVLDLAHDFAQPTIAALDLADVIVVPITPDISSARLTQAALKVFEALGYRNDPFLIQNRTFPKQGIERTQLEKFLERPIQLLIPYVEGVWGDAINLGIPVINGDLDTLLVRTLEDLSWLLSDSELRQEQPTEPTPTWQRVAKRIGQKAR